MNTMNVNGQNGVATSAKMMCENKFEGLMYNDQTASIMYEIGGWTSEQKQGLLDKILRMRMRNKSAITFVYNDIKFTLNWGVIFSTSERIFQIYATGKTNGRYSYGAGVAIRRFPNYYGISEVLNTLMRNLVADMFEVADIEKAESDRKLAEDLNSPDTSEECDGFIGLENASETCDNNMMACVDKYGQEFIDRVLNEYADVVYNAVSDYDLNDTIKYCVKTALNFMEYDPEKKRLVGLSVVPDLCGWDDEDEFCNYFENAYCFDWDSCQEFYQEYCDNIWHFADEYDDQMEDALKDFDEESVFDKMFYKIDYDGEYINVYIDMDDFVDYIHKKIIIFNNFNSGKAQLFKYENLGINLYNMLDSDNVDVDKHFKVSNYSWLFCRDLENMLPMVTDVKLYDDGLYVYHMTFNEYFKEIPISLDLKNITISEYYKLSEKIIDGSTKFVDGCFNYYIRKSQYCSSCGDVTHYYYDVVYYINGCAIVKFYGENLSMAEIIENFREYMPKEIHSMICYDLGI